MDKYIEGKKAAWEEAFDNRDASWGADITERIQNEDYPFFNEETRNVLKKIHTEGTVIGQFCCNNGRELLSLVKCGKAKQGIGFDIAENQVAFANEKARELGLPCEFVAANIRDADSSPMRSAYFLANASIRPHTCELKLCSAVSGDFSTAEKSKERTR